MQKKLIALAVAAVAGSAFAQTNVTLYGVADATLDNVWAAKSTAAVGLKNDQRVSSNSSYIGFKGTEDLGNGLKALFQFETGVSQDAGGWGAGRDTFVGLTGGFGTVLAGNLTAAARGLGARMDVNAGATGVGYQGAIFGRTVGGRTTVDDRTANAIAFVTPNYSGFSALVAWGAGSEAKTANAADNVYSVGLNYANGPLDVGYAYTKVDNYKTSADAKSNRLGAGYTFGANKVTAIVDQTDANTAAANTKRTTYTLAGKFGVTAAGSLLAGASKAGNLDGTSNTGAKSFFVGYEHALSKRTVLKAVFTKIYNKSGADYNFYNGSTGEVSGLVKGQDPTAIQVGIRHSF